MELFNEITDNLLTLNEASQWASEYLKKRISKSNISYLVQYGKIKRQKENGQVFVSIDDLRNYYDTYSGKRQIKWKDKLGDDLNWRLSFDYLREKDTTKHVHRLHPYKGKFIPQLVEYFIDSKTDEFKKNVFFKKDDIILDPFCGSGTTLVQANELGIDAIGIDVSEYNTLIANVKINNYNITDFLKIMKEIHLKYKKYLAKNNYFDFEEELSTKLTEFNREYFPTPDYKLKIKNKEIHEFNYSKEKENEMTKIYISLLKKYNVKLNQNNSGDFLTKWFIKPILEEIYFLYDLVSEIKNERLKHLFFVILSRTMRSCRATTHFDLATLKEPKTETYYCRKHKKICKPLFSMYKWWSKYTTDTVERISKFNEVKTNTKQICLKGDARNVDIILELNKHDAEFANKVKHQKIKGIFSSPPYVGLINYHEQHEYAYELFGFNRNDEQEIGPLFKGTSLNAQKEYVKGISRVLTNCKKFLSNDFDIFLVANDKYNLYPEIAKLSELVIVNEYKRPVLNRTERDRRPYAEIIFHMKNKM